MVCVRKTLCALIMFWQSQMRRILEGWGEGGGAPMSASKGIRKYANCPWGRNPKVNPRTIINHYHYYHNFSMYLWIILITRYKWNDYIGRVFFRGIFYLIFWVFNSAQQLEVRQKPKLNREDNLRSSMLPAMLLATYAILASYKIVSPIYSSMSAHAVGVTAVTHFAGHAYITLYYIRYINYNLC